MTFPDENACRCCADIVASHKGDAVFSQAYQTTLLGRHFDFVTERFRLVVHAQDTPGRRVLDQMLLADPVGGSVGRLMPLAGSGRQHEHNVLHAGLDGCVDGGDELLAACARAQVRARNEQEAVKTRAFAAAKSP